jgi:hypothetical protein
VIVRRQHPIQERPERVGDLPTIVALGRIEQFASYQFVNLRFPDLKWNHSEPVAAAFAVCAHTSGRRRAAM